MSQLHKKTGIALFVYNRPEHTRQVLKGLERNNLDHLYVFADGPKNSEDVNKVAETRGVIKKIDWCDVDMIQRDENWGLAKSLINGINRVFQDHERIIVLEDDCVPAPQFIEFMQTLLEKYNENDQVMNINGYSPPLDLPDYNSDIYFTYRSSSWGWGTWKAAWEKYQRGREFLDKIKQNERLVEKVQKAGYDLIPMADFDLDNKTSSWAVWWSLTIAVNEGLCVNPVDSLVENIGHDESGTHTKDRFWRNMNKGNFPPETSVEDIEFPDNPSADIDINKRYRKKIGAGRLALLKYWVKNLLGVY